MSQKHCLYVYFYQIQPDMLSMDRAALGRFNTKSLQEKMEEKAKLLVNVDCICCISSVTLYAMKCFMLKSTLANCCALLKN